MNSLAKPWISSSIFTAAMMLVLLYGHNLCAQPASTISEGGPIQTFPVPEARSYDAAIAKHLIIKRADIQIQRNTVLQFYERPKEIDDYNSAINVIRGGHVVKTYHIGGEIGDESLRLVHVAKIPSGEAGIVVAEFEGGGVGAREGFAVIRYSPTDVELHTLPLADYGKVVVFRSDPSEVEVWSADRDVDIGSPVEDRPYLIRNCRWGSESFSCGPPLRVPKLFAPGSISDPGIEIRP